MDRTEKKNLIVGSIVIAAAVLFFGYLLLSPKSDNSSREYIVISTLPATPGLVEGTPVFMDGKKIGMVQKVVVSSKRNITNVRMGIKKESFGHIGTDSVAWIERTESGLVKHVAIRRGRPGAFGQFIRIKPVRGITGQPEGQPKDQ